MPYPIDPNNPPLIRQGKNSSKCVSTYEINNDDPDNPAFLRIINADQQLLEFSVSITQDPDNGYKPVFTKIITDRTEPFVIPPKYQAQITVLVVDNDNPDHIFTIPMQTEASEVSKENCYVIGKKGINQGYII